LVKISIFLSVSASHQSGHNSGVIHTGIYYKPGSLKAKLCVRGADLMYDYCNKHQIPYRRCGKIIVAVDESEVPRLKDLYERGIKNGVRDITLIDREKMKEIEPNCEGVMAIHSPYTGIVDYKKVALSYAEDFQKAGGSVFMGYEVDQFSSSDSLVQVAGKSQDPILSRYVITCGGLHSDRLAVTSGCKPEPRIMPFRGEYLQLKPGREKLVNGNIYPVPDPRFPFLGVHFTPRMDGAVWLGPNAVLAFAREGYKWSDLCWKDIREEMSFRGLWKLVGKYWRFGSGEVYRSLVVRAQVKKLQKYVPGLQLSDVERGPTGVRAMAMGNDGSLIEDFVFDAGSGPLGQRMLHVRNAPSPAATSSLAIAEMIVDKVEQTFDIKNIM
jgi:2-hydroxyglutarate dehydrogenase